jgi:hypothetical protein
MSFAAHQAETAEQLGYGDNVRAMNMEHDPLHGALCHFLGVTSFALADARGEVLSHQQRELAAAEEAAVLGLSSLPRSNRQCLTQHSTA